MRAHPSPSERRQIIRPQIAAFALARCTQRSMTDYLRFNTRGRDETAKRPDNVALSIVRKAEGLPIARRVLWTLRIARHQRQHAYALKKSHRNTSLAEHRARDVAAASRLPNRNLCRLNRAENKPKRQQNSKNQRLHLQSCQNTVNGVHASPRNKNLTTSRTIFSVFSNF